MNTKLLAQLFLTFAKVGVMTFGGGMAMLPILQREVVEDKGWATDEELVDYFAIGQCTPGIIAVNTATFIGQKQAGIIGGIVATLGIVFPSLIIITALAGVINSFSHLAWVQHAFAGIRVCVCVLIFNAVVKLFKGSVKDWAAGLIFLAVLAAALLTDLSPVIFVAAAAALGIVIQNVIRRAKYCCTSNYSGNSSRPVCSPWAAGWPLCPSCRIWPTAPAGSPMRSWRICWRCPSPRRDPLV